jgi:hypothetical protein
MNADIFFAFVIVVVTCRHADVLGEQNFFGIISGLSFDNDRGIAFRMFDIRAFDVVRRRARSDIRFG